jgi:hypothetical protein
MRETPGTIMLNRLTVSALLKAVILTTAFCVVIGFSQRLGLLEPPPGREPDFGDCRHLGEPVQGDA